MGPKGFFEMACIKLISHNTVCLLVGSGELSGKQQSARLFVLKSKAQKIIRAAVDPIVAKI
jgi:hypothetical protein